MKFTQLLYKQHIGKAIRYLWQHQRERNVVLSKAEEILKSMNVPVVDATEFVSEQTKKCLNFKIIENLNTSNKTDPDYMSKSCLVFENHNVLQEDIPQACLLTNTIIVDNELPKKVKDLITDIPDNINNLLRRIVCTSVIYDAQQVKLPRLKDPNRPAWNFPRVYGICTTRKMHNLSKKFLQLCESLCGLNDAQCRAVVHNGLLSTCIGKEDKLIHLSSKIDIMMTSLIPLTPIADTNTDIEFEMPDLYPLHCTIGLTKSKISTEKQDLYPVTMESPFMNAHTIFVNNDPEEVKNLTELPVTENQIYARSMMKSFTVAVTCARQKFGLRVKKLPEPIVVQCVQSDAQNFHFSVYQLNTLDIDDNEGIKNFWWSEPLIKLYDEAKYENGQPYLRGYNSDVFKRILAFYKNK